MADNNWRCNKCKNRKDIEHKFCKHCETSYHTLDSKIADSCACGKYSTVRKICDYCELEDNVEHKVCKKCRTSYHISTINKTVINSCQCKLHRTINIIPVVLIESDDESDYDILEPVSACYCEGRCECDNIKTYHSYNKNGRTFMRRHSSF